MGGGGFISFRLILPKLSITLPLLRNRATITMEMKLNALS
jgi:hypothetical protein